MVISMKVKDIVNKIRNVKFIIIYKNGYSKSMLINELRTEDLEQDFSWFEVTVFNGEFCLEFNL